MTRENIADLETLRKKIDEADGDLLSRADARNDPDVDGCLSRWTLQSRLGARDRLTYGSSRSSYLKASGPGRSKTYTLG